MDGRDFKGAEPLMRAGVDTLCNLDRFVVSFLCWLGFFVTLAVGAGIFIGWLIWG